MKYTRKPARTAADVAMSKTNPAEPDEPQAPKPPIDTRTRWEVLPGSIGPICKWCHQGIRSHFEGYCEPLPESFDEQQGIPGDPEQPEIRVTQHQEEPIVNERAAAKIQIQGEEEIFTPSGYERIGVVDQALELLDILPDCPEREMLARRCALMIGGQLQILGYTVAEEQE